MIIPAYANSIYDNPYFDGETAYKYYNELMWPVRYAQTVSVEEAIAMTLVGNPKLIILDEPINGLDPQGINDLRDLIVKLNKEQNITFFISSHILDEMAKFCTDYLYTFAMGICMVCSYTSLYFFVVMQSGSKVKALVINMIIGCILLFLGMRDNQIMMQKDVADSLYRTIHEITFDVNPAGQAAQVSAMKFLNPIRFVVSDFVMIAVVGLLGKMLFDRKQLS